MPENIVIRQGVALSRSLKITDTGLSGNTDPNYCRRAFNNTAGLGSRVLFMHGKRNSVEALFRVYEFRDRSRGANIFMPKNDGRWKRAEKDSCLAVRLTVISYTVFSHPRKLFSIIRETLVKSTFSR